MPYTYTATVARVIDGDTLTADIDLGFWLTLHISLRIAGINAREHNQPGGPEARDNLATLTPPGTTITATTLRPDKYAGRADAHIQLPNGRDLATILILDGWAAAWNGQGPKPIPDWPRP